VLFSNQRGRHRERAHEVVPIADTHDLTEIVRAVELVQIPDCLGIMVIGERQGRVAQEQSKPGQRVDALLRPGTMCGGAGNLEVYALLSFLDVDSEAATLLFIFADEAGARGL